MAFTLVPVIFENHPYNRLLVEPTRISETISEGGVLLPGRENRLASQGKVVSVCEGSEYMPGDDLLYKKIDRSSGAHLDTVSIDDKVYDVIFENEVFSRNAVPVNRIFVQPIVAEKEKESGGIIIPAEVKGVVQKGIIHSCPVNFRASAGDAIEYRKQENQMYGEVEIDGVDLHVLYEADIFRINGRVAPYRIIIKIDIGAQRIKRNSTMGIALSPLFKFMLYNMQMGEIVDIGEDAAKMYPELCIGDTAIIHHSIESQDYRLIQQDIGKHDVSYEYRIINCFDPQSREIFGKINYNKKNNKIIDLTPFGENVFLKWNFNLFNADTNSELIEFSSSLHKYHNLDDLKQVIAKNKSLAAEKAKLKVSGIKNVMAFVNPEVEQERAMNLVWELKAIENEEKKIARRLSNDHLVVCRKYDITSIPQYVITHYEELYPINLLGQKFLIAYQPFIRFQTNNDMPTKVAELSAYKLNVLVLPIVEQNNSGLFIPGMAKEKPQKGIVISIDPDNPKIKKGYTVLFRKNSGFEQDLEGVTHLIIRDEDVLGFFPVAEEELLSERQT